MPLSPARPFRSAGFTLVELLAGVLVVGILVAIAMPYYGDYRNRVRNTQACQDIAGLEARIETYRATHNVLPASLADIGEDGMLDPWGRAYVYYDIEANGKGGARKDHALNPLNADYDLYSVGADGLTKKQITQKDSLDDLIRASNGSFVGLAAEF